MPPPSQLFGSVSPLVANQDALISLSFPEEACTEWLITMLGMRFQSGGAPGPLQGINNVDQQLAKVRVQYGVGGAMEDTLVDYPWGGGTFVVNASVLRVFTPAALAVAQFQSNPLIGAFASRTSGRSFPNAPTFTTPTAPTNTGASAVFLMPARARWYIPYVIDQIPGDTSVFRLLQEMPNGNTVKQDSVNSLIVPNGQNLTGSDIRHAIHPRATQIEIQQNTAAITRNVGIIFELDLG